MSGRDYRSFLLKSRFNKAGVIRRLQKEPVQNIIQLDTKDYQNFEAFNTWAESDSKLENLQKIKQKRNEQRENRLMKQHYVSWNWESLQLDNQKKQLEEEILELVKKWQLEGENLKEISTIQSQLEVETEKFWETSVCPVLQLRDDIKVWLENFELGRDEGQGSADSVQQIINSVKTQQDAVLNGLNEESQSLSKELLKDNNSEPKLPFGVPEAFRSLVCPSEELFTSITDEFIIIDIKYHQKYLDLQNLFQPSLKLSFGGWSQDDHMVYRYVIEHYSENLSNRQELIYDLLQRLLPHKELGDLLAHEEWLMEWRRYQNASVALISDWQRYKEELLNKAKTVFEEACIKIEESAKKVASLALQKVISEELYNKVKIWRQNKLECLRLQEEEERKQYLEFNKQQKEKELKRRYEIKEKLQLYNNHKKAAKLEEVKMQRREKEMQNQIRSQEAIFNRKRVRFRQMKWDEYKKQCEQMQMQAKLEEMEREKRLEKLRQKVAVEVPRDPFRLLQSTKAANAKRKTIFEEEEYPINKPLFEIFTFTDQQLVADTRIRLEQKLREANLIHLPYAQEVLKNVLPPCPPRRDMFSTFRFTEE